MQWYLSHGTLPIQVLDLGEIQVVESWREGDVRYEKLVTIPDYERCGAAFD